MTSPDNIKRVATLSPSMMGFIFYRNSPRYANSIPVEVIASLPPAITPVGVFVDASTDEITATASRYGINTIQLHGHESPHQCEELRASGFHIIKAFGIDTTIDWDSIAPYQAHSDFFLFDTKTDAHGGSGHKFNWLSLCNYPLTTPYILSGGISPDDCHDIIVFRQPLMAGIDINSRFECSPGIKNISLLSSFISSLRKSF